jgi:uncharacterized protein (DUF1800 family)
MALSAAAAHDALIAFNRFGLGARPGGPGEIGDDPRAALRREINNPNTALINRGNLPGYAEACRASQMGFDAASKNYDRELNARIDKQMSAEVGFVERLVMFWSNHFSMSVNKDDTIFGTMGQWERDVIRPNVLGKFRDMLRGTIRHPAMLAFLDNQDSIGPNSRIGRDWGVGLNENLGRELMELHTIGSGGGYTETDVTAMAKILTGWSFVRGWESDDHYNGGNARNKGQFIYRASWHEPGRITLMGKSYGPTGMQQVNEVLDDLAVHPATAEHIAFKLVYHFITDEPTPSMVDRLKNAFISSRGDLKQVAFALITMPEAWTLPLTKFRTPYELTVAQYRALGERYKNDDRWLLTEPLYALHNMAWEAPSPKGYSDTTATWLNPDALRVRLDVAQMTSWSYKPDFHGNTAGLARQLFDSALSDATRARIAAAEDPNAGLTVLLSSPEFQRR